jgi:N-acetylmuramoyl-L-alanine amidase
MSKYIWLFDAGHGGMIDGEYQTAGKRSPIWDDGSQYFEGVGNRVLVKKTIEALKAKGIDARDIVNSEKDIPLRTRVQRANKIHQETGGKTIYVSVHSDAFSKESANGYSVYTSKGQTKSDKVAEIFLDKLEAKFPERELRTDPRDGDKDKEENFYVVKNTYSPAILIENFFMTNESECKEILMTKKGQNKIVKAYVEAVLEIEENGIK